MVGQIEIVDFFPPSLAHMIVYSLLKAFDGAG